MKKLLLLLVAGLMLQSCATVFAPTQKTHIAASEKGAKVVVNGFDKGFTPIVLKLKADDFVEISKPGFETKTVNVGSKFNGVSILNLTSLLGWGIDAITGAIKKPEYKTYKVTLDGVVEVMEDKVIVKQNKVVEVHIGMDIMSFRANYPAAHLHSLESGKAVYMMGDKLIHFENDKLIKIGGSGTETLTLKKN